METLRAYSAFKYILYAKYGNAPGKKERSIMCTRENTRTYRDAIYCNIFKSTWRALERLRRSKNGCWAFLFIYLFSSFFFSHRARLCVLPSGETSRGCVPCKATEKEEKIRLPLLLTPRVRQIRMQM